MPLLLKKDGQEKLRASNSFCGFAVANGDWEYFIGAVRFGWFLLMDGIFLRGLGGEMGCFAARDTRLGC